MSQLDKLKMDTAVKDVYLSWPESISGRLLQIRQAIYQVAQDNNINPVTETLKWGQPSYLAPKGSTIRLGYESETNSCMVYFHCKTTLVETFRELYGDSFTFEGNRAIKLATEEPVPLVELEHCLLLSLRYHQIKHLPMLGA